MARWLQQDGARVVIHSDDASGIQRLNQEAAKAMYHGRRAGISDYARPGSAVGLRRTGVGARPRLDRRHARTREDADVVLWSADRCRCTPAPIQVYNDGWVVIDRKRSAHQPKTGLLLGAAMIAYLLAQTIAINGGTVYPGLGAKIEHATVLIRDGRIAAVGTNVPVPARATRVDARGNGFSRADRWRGADGTGEIGAVQGTSEYTQRGTTSRRLTSSRASIPRPPSCGEPDGGVTTTLAVPDRWVSRRVAV